jgi:hypothetical protein
MQELCLQVQMMCGIIFPISKSADLICDVDSLDAVLFQKGYHRAVKLVSTLIE